MIRLFMFVMLFLTLCSQDYPVYVVDYLSLLVAMASELNQNALQYSI